MMHSRPTRTLARLTAGLPLIIAPLLPAIGPAYGSTPVPPALECAGVDVPAGYICTPEPKQCFAPPCPQYRLDPIREPGPFGEGWPSL